MMLLQLFVLKSNALTLPETGILQYNKIFVASSDNQYPLSGRALYGHNTTLRTLLHGIREPANIQTLSDLPPIRHKYG